VKNKKTPRPECAAIVAEGEATGKEKENFQFAMVKNKRMIRFSFGGSGWK
jgi:hypothetical protein